MTTLPLYSCSVCGKDFDYLHSSPISLVVGGQGDEDVIADMIVCRGCDDRTIALIVEKMVELGATDRRSSS